MGLLRKSGEPNAPAPALKKKPPRAVRACVSVLDDGYLVGHDGDQKHRVEQPGEAADGVVEEGLWTSNQLVWDDAEQMAPHMTSSLASLNRELKVLEVRYFRTRLQLEKSMDKVRRVLR